MDPERRKRSVFKRNPVKNNFKTVLRNLDININRLSAVVAEQLKNKSHNKIWLKNYREGKSKKVIATMDLAESAHASEAMKEYIKENLEIERACA